MIYQLKVSSWDCSRLERYVTITTHNSNGCPLDLVFNYLDGAIG